MALQPHPRSAIPRSRVRGSPLLPLAGHQFLGPDDNPFAIEGRGTPRDTTEGLDQDTLSRSDHSDPFHKHPRRLPGGGRLPGLLRKVIGSNEGTGAQRIDRSRAPPLEPWQWIRGGPHPRGASHQTGLRQKTLNLARVQEPYVF